MGTRRFMPFVLVTALFTATLVSTSTRSGAEDASDEPIAGSYIVDLKPGVSAKKYSAEIAKRYRGKVAFIYDRVVGGFAFQGSASAAEKLARDRRVRFVEQDRVARVLGDPPSDVNHLNRADVPEAFDAGYTGLGIKIALLDTGVDKNHQAFAHGNILPGFGGCASNDDDKTGDPNGHGTASASNAVGRIGIAHLAQVIPVKVFRGRSDVTSWTRVICGLNWVRNQSDADIVNISIGGSGSQALRDAIAQVIADGIVVVAAAGNNGGATKAPARYPGVVAVSALAGGSKMASFSATGGDMTAPGVNILSARNNTLNGYERRTGTSRSSPQVAGGAAIILAENPGLSVSGVRDALQASGRCPNGSINGSPGFCTGRWRGDDTNAEPQLNAYCAGIYADALAVDPINCGF